MEIRHAFAKVLRKTRKANGLTQEDFAEVSSRTYLSTLERGQKSPTLDKVQFLAQTIGIHMLSLLTLTYLYSKNELDIDSLFLPLHGALCSNSVSSRDKSTDNFFYSYATQGIS